MESALKEDVVKAYSEGFSTESIANKYGISLETVKEILYVFRDEQRVKRAFTDVFKKVIAERDISGVSRTDIANEMGININTVKKSCEQFGQNFKEKATSDNLYTRIEGKHPKNKCVVCDSNHYNLIDDNVHYCRKCGNEFIHKRDHVLMVNWEYVD